MKKPIAFATLLATLVGSSAFAANYGYGSLSRNESAGPYFGFSAGELLYNEDGLDQLAPVIGVFRFGQQFSPNIAIEGRLGTGINAGTSNGYRVNVDVLYGGYVKGILPLSPTASIYGLAGIGGAQLHRDYPGFNSTDAGLSFGVGAEFNLGGGASLDVEWTRLTTGNNVGYDWSADQITFGANWRL